MMVNALRVEYPDLQLAIENPISRYILLKKRVARLGLVRVGGQILFMLYLVMLKRLSAKSIQSIVASSGLSAKPPHGLSIAQFDSVNSQACIEWLQKKKPTVVILNGTSILSTELLASCNALFLNIHCGVTPTYRGVHGGYWALFCGDKDSVGVTVHVVDKGVDTGNIVFQETIQIDHQDNFLTYPVKQYIVGIPLIRQAIADAVSGNLKTYRRDDLPSAIWSHPTIWQYIWARLRYGVR
jgi:folate-dependent phosphoribosylglycinamide formyltransferase PurN